MTAAHAYELPPEHGHDLVLPAAEIDAVEHGEVVSLTRGGRPVAAVVPIDPDQWWYWTPQWQAMEREVDAEIAAGVPARVFDSGKEFLAHLEARIDAPTIPR